ncbi:MAG: phosphate/phosphite/phosphonate ABC transporter substrate-binding protein [Burkholderiales bacterium]|nr:phosphate/phosphite/phosphonate ABC transporter substrate-binding protein [Burkholderiales bacterium]
MMKSLLMALGAVFALGAASAVAAPAPALPALKIAIHDEGGAEGEPLPPLSRYAPLKKVLETGLGRPIEISLTRDRKRLFEWMERNQADIFMTTAADLAAKALATLKYQYVAMARPDVAVIFVGKGAPIDNLKKLAGQAIGMPRPDTMFGQVCAAELRDFIGQQYTARPSTEYAAVIYAVENNLAQAGCIPATARARETMGEKGIKVIYEGRLQPALPVVANPTVSAADRAALGRILGGLEDTPTGEPALKALGVAAFTEGGETRLRMLNAWLTGTNK